MQINAISDAKAAVSNANALIMIPQIITVQELLWVKKMVKEPSVKVGIMMETVRACMRADSLGQTAAFFSFGTNDLTQATYSFSREDVEKKLLSYYLDHGILMDNPFETIDVNGVGKLIETAITWARQVNPHLDIGVCGEHGGDPRSIHFFHGIGISYVSCSPFRVPIARLVAAQAALDEKERLIRLTKEA
jgi:pyruvate,orthophosphate dikinase